MTEFDPADPATWLERYAEKPGDVRLLGCPFCGVAFGAWPHPPAHLAECDAFEAAWRDDVDERGRRRVTAD